MIRTAQASFLRRFPPRSMTCCRTPRSLFSTVTSPSDNDDKKATATTPGAPLMNKISVVGAGMMASALVEPMVQTGLQPGGNFSVYDVSDEAMNRFHKDYGVVVSDSMQDCLQDSNLVLLTVKPQNLTDAFFEQMKQAELAPGAILLSVLAGTPISTLQQTGVEKIVRSMPNTPATIGQGMTVWSCTSDLTSSDRKQVKKILNSFGEALYVHTEDKIDMSTSISGSGPAYIFMLMEAMIDAGVHMGFPRDQATTLVYHTMLGSTLYAIQSHEHPAILRNRVTSPSGTTASAIYELENGRFRTTIKDAMWACYRRSLEMGNHDSNVGPHRAQGGPHNL